jgi:hypothetical protein
MNSISVVKAVGVFDAKAAFAGKKENSRIT